MDASSKLALAVVAGAFVLVGGYIGYREFERQRDIHDVHEFVGEVSKWPAQIEAQARQDEALRRQRAAELAAVDRARRTLGPEHRCADGVVVEVRGTSFTQVGSFGHPVRCAGNLADRPLR